MDTWWLWRLRCKPSGLHCRVGWLATVNIRAFIENGVMYGYEKCVQRATGESCDWVERELAFGNSAIFLLVLIAVLVLSAWLVFRRRDVN